MSLDGRLALVAITGLVMPLSSPTPVTASGNRREPCAENFDFLIGRWRVQHHRLTQRAGGFALLEGWKTTLTGLTPAEAQAVFLSGLAGPAAQLGLGGDLKAARLKLLMALPAAWRDRAQIVSSRLHLDPVDW
jgi:hypothetical protein